MMLIEKGYWLLVKSDDYNKLLKDFDTLKDIESIYPTYGKI